MNSHMQDDLDVGQIFNSTTYGRWRLVWLRSRGCCTSVSLFKQAGLLHSKTGISKVMIWFFKSAMYILSIWRILILVEHSNKIFPIDSVCICKTFLFVWDRSVVWRISQMKILGFWTWSTLLFYAAATEIFTGTWMILGYLIFLSTGNNL